MNREGGSRLKFCSKYPQTKPYLVGGLGMPFEQFFTAKAVDFL